MMMGTDAIVRRVSLSNGTHLPSESPLSSNSLPHNENLRQSPFSLLFENPEVEADFVRHIHPKPRIVVPITEACATLLYVQYLISGDRGQNIDFGAIVFGLVCSIIINVAFRWFTKSTTERDLLLAAERACTCFVVMVILAHQVYFQMRFYSDCSSLSRIEVMDLSRQYEEANCNHVYVAITISLLAALFAASNFIRFPYMVAMCMYLLGLHLIMWVIVEPTNMLFNVWLNAVFVAASLSFIAFVRHDQEQVQRQQFVQSRRLVMEQERLAEREQSLAEFCSMLLPRSLLRRVGSFEASHTTDESSSGTALVVGIHDFGVWCTRNQPTTVAQGVVQLQSAVRTIATLHRLDFVGSVGDSVACVGNLCVEQRQASWNTCAALLDIVQTVSSAVSDAGRQDELPPLRAAAHLGQLWGSFGHGCGGVRYDVYGPALESALSALLDCPAGRGLASLTLMDGAGASAEMFDVVSTVGEENFVVLDRLEATHSLEHRTSVVGPESAAQAAVEFDALHEALQNSWRSPDGGATMRVAPPTCFGSPTQHRLSHSTSQENSENEDQKPQPAELREKLERFKEVRMVWCCFPRFVDDEVEDAYVAERMEALPEAASRTWFAYALYVLVILCLLLVDMHEPNGVIGVVLLALASLLSVAMGAVPKVLTREAMSRWYFVWSVVGVVLPLLVVYGCAVSRPSAVGNDASLYPVLGAFVRSYCFASSRWQAVVVPLMTAAGLLQYLLPGGLIRYGIFFVIMLVAVIVVGEHEREEAHRENARRKVERKLLLAQSRVEEALRDGLLRSTVPDPVLSFVRPGLQRGGGSRSHVLMAEGVTMVVRALSGSSSAKRFEALDIVLSQCRGILSMSGLLGDEAVVVGPVPRGFSAMDRPEEEDRCAAVKAAVMIGTRLARETPVHNSSGSLLSSPSEPSLHRASFSSNTSSGDSRSFSVVMDVDEVVHTLEVGEFAQYWALGVSVTRLMAIVQGADASALLGCLATDRLVKRAKQFEIVAENQARALGPMKVRGAGMVRLSQIGCVDATD